jgi:PAS domain S-box-containing protein
LKEGSLDVPALLRLLETTSAETGIAFFRALVRTLAEVQGARGVYLGELLPGRRMRILAACADGRDVDLLEQDLSGPCVATVAAGVPLVLNGNLAELFADDPTIVALRATSYLGVPVCRPNGAVLGILATFGAGPMADNADRVVSAYAARAAAEIERAAAEEAERARTAKTLEHQRVLLDLAQLPMTDLRAHVRTLLERCSHALGVERVSYWALLDEGRAIECEHLFTRSTGAFTSGARLDESTYPAYFAALRTRKTIVADDARVDPRTREFTPNYFGPFGIASLLDVPMWRSGELSGVVCLEHVGEVRRWSMEDEELARSVAHMISLALEAHARSRAEERYRLVSTATGEVVWELDLLSERIEWSDALSRVFGYPAFTSSSLAWWLSRIHLADRARVDEGLRGALRGEVDSWSDEYRFFRGDGQVAYVHDRGFVTRDAQGRPVRMIGSIQDVTGRKELEARLILADRMASMGTLAAGVAHEINNPLAYVRANIDHVLEDLRLRRDLDPDLVKALEEAREGAERVRAIVGDLKTFSRPDAAPTGAVDLEAVIDSSVAMAWNEIRHRAKLVKSYGRPPPVEGSEARVGQVVLNLLVNAAQAMPEGNADANELRIVTGASGASDVFFSISDTGVGISEEVAARLFDPFFTTKPVGEGTGLGLAICHSIVQTLGGEITFDSAPGKGTTFRVTLPRAASAAQAAASTQTADAKSRRGRVLVIDDDVSVSVAIKRCLAREHDVELAIGGQQALAKISGGASYEVILCDLMMPDVSGMDVYAELERSRPEVARRVVFVTGGAFTPRARDFLSSTPQPVMEKPFDAGELRRLVRGIVREGGAARAGAQRLAK